MQIKFATQSYKHDSLRLSAQRCKNFFAERQPPDAKSEVAVLGCPGISDFATCGSGPVRGFVEMNEIVYTVSGGTLFSIAETGVATARGSTITGAGVVSMDTNGEQISIVNGANGYIYTEAGGLQLVTDPDFHAANTTTFADSFFIHDRIGTNEFFISDVYDGVSYSDFFASAEWQQDQLLAVTSHSDLLFLLGKSSIEKWAISGAANFPYQRLKGASLRRGMIAPHAFALDESSIYLLGDDRIAYRLVGNQGRFSTHALETEWQRYPVDDEINAFTFTFNGHKLCYFNFVRANVTFGFDASTGLWHERESRDQNNNSLGRWRANCAIGAYGKVLVGDAFTGRIGYLDNKVYTEFGNTIHGELVSPPIHAAGRRASMPWFELEVESGVGLASGQGSAPRMMLDISDDGGHTWDGPQEWASMGAAGDYRTRLAWDRLGSFDETRHLRLTVSDPVPRKIMGARCPDLYVGT